MARYVREGRLHLLKALYPKGERVYHRLRAWPPSSLADGNEVHVCLNIKFVGKIARPLRQSQINFAGRLRLPGKHRIVFAYLIRTSQ